MDNKSYNLSLKAVTKIYSRRTIFQDISIDYTAAGIYGIAGSNGMGKSTLVKVIANIISPTSGKIMHRLQAADIAEQKLHNHVGFLSPYFVFYEEFSAEENIFLFLNIRGVTPDVPYINGLFEKLMIHSRKNDLVKTYSSGMKQRLKLIFALAHKPHLLILDEPTSNLDDAGKEQFYQLINEHAEKMIILVASNEKTDLSLCSSILRLEDYK